MTQQMQLGFAPTLQERFEMWRCENPEIVARVKAVALSLKRNGHSRWGMKAIFEYIRFETALREKGGRFKLNNDYTSCLARWLMEREPELAGFFSTRGDG